LGGFLKRYIFFLLTIVLFMSQIFCTSLIYEVKVTGVGETVQIAVENGLRQAIEIAVGALIRGYSELDSNLTVTATDIIEQTAFREKIISFSKAYIERYEILDSYEKWGLRHVDLFCEVRQSALESTMLRNGIGETHFDGSQLLNIFEQNRITDINSGEMVTAVFEDFSVPCGFWEVSEVKTEMLDSTAQEVKIRVSIILSPDLEKYKGFLSELKEVLRVVCEKSVYENVKAETHSAWKSLLISSFLSDSKYPDVVRIFDQAKNNEIIFHDYYFRPYVLIEKEFIEALKNLYHKSPSYSLRLVFYNAFGEELFRKDHIRTSQSGFLLNNNAFGFSFSSQKGSQFYILPGSFRSEPGKIKLSLEDIHLSLELTASKDIFKEAVKAVVEIVQ